MLIKKERIPVLHILFIGLLPSFLKKMVYRIRGYSIGKNVNISMGAVVIGRKVKLNDNVKIGFFTIVRGREITLERFVKIGSMSVIDTERIYIDEDARINEQVYIGGMKTPQSSLHMGKRTIIMQMSYLNPTLPITIGDDSGIGGHCLLFTHGSWNSQLEGYPVKFAPITLGKKVWFPWRVFVMPGIEIGDNVVIGANSLITANVPSNCLAAGNPAKVLKDNFPAPPTDFQQMGMVEKIFTDFFEYLKYFEFHVNISKSENGFEAEIKSSNKQGKIIYQKKYVEENASSRNTILVLFTATAQQVEVAYAKGFGMVISLSDNLRIGTCDTGEELTQFLSRYGVRFSRLD